MLEPEEQIVFGRISDKQFWPAVLCRKSLEGLNRLTFFEKPELKIQKRKDEDIIPFEEGLQKYYDCKQDQIQVAIYKAQFWVMQEQQRLSGKQDKESNQKTISKTKSKSKQNCLDQNKSLNVQSEQNMEKSINSDLKKRKSAKSSTNKINETLQKNQDENGTVDLQPSKKQKTTEEQKKKVTKNKKKIISSEVINDVNTNLNLVQSELTDKNKNDVKQQEITSQKIVGKKKNEKINIKQEQKISNIEQNIQNEQKKTPTRSKKKVQQNEQKQDKEQQSITKLLESAQKDNLLTPKKCKSSTPIKHKSAKTIKGNINSFSNEQLNNNTENSLNQPQKPEKKDKKQKQEKIKEQEEEIKEIDTQQQNQTPKNKRGRKKNNLDNSLNLPVVSKNNDCSSQDKQETIHNQSISKQKNDRNSEQNIQQDKNLKKNYKKKNNNQCSQEDKQDVIHNDLIDKEKNDRDQEQSIQKNKKAKRNNKKDNQTILATTKNIEKPQEDKEETVQKKSKGKQKNDKKPEQNVSKDNTPKKNNQRGKRKIKSEIKENQILQESDLHQFINECEKFQYDKQNNEVIQEVNKSQEMQLENCEQNNKNDSNNNLYQNILSSHLVESPGFRFKQSIESVLSNNINRQNADDDISNGLLKDITNNLLLNNLLNNTQNSQNNVNSLFNNRKNSLNNSILKDLNLNSPYLSNNSLKEKQPSYVENNKENFNHTFSLNNNPYRNNSIMNNKNYSNNQDELNLKSGSQQALTDQQQQTILNALKSANLTSEQFDFFSQKLINGQNTLNQLDTQNKQSNSNNIMNSQNIKYNSIFRSQQNSQTSDILSSIENKNNIFGNIINTNIYNKGNTLSPNSVLNDISYQINPLIKQKQEFSEILNNSINSFSMNNQMTQQNSAFQFGMQKQEFQQPPLPSLSSQNSLNSQIFGLGSQGDFLSTNDVLQYSQGLSLQQNKSLYPSSIQSQTIQQSFGVENDNQLNSKNHSIVIPSPKFVNKSNNQHNLQISNNSSFKLSYSPIKQVQHEVHVWMKNKILPMLENKIKNKLYFENEKETWLCEIIDCVRQLKQIPIEQIYQGEYSMLLEQIYDALLTIQEHTKRNFSYILSMIQRTMTDLDKRIIKHLHDYSRVRGEKYQKTREHEIMKKQTYAHQQVIKIEDKDDIIELSPDSQFIEISQFNSQVSYNSPRKSQQDKPQDLLQNKVKYDPEQDINFMSPPQKKRFNESETTTKKQKNNNDNTNNNSNENILNINYDNKNSCNNISLGNNINTTFNQIINNDLFCININQALCQINNQSDISNSFN